MRIIAGTARGTKLEAVPGDTTRPILDRVRTSLFDILRPQIKDMKLLDLFGGSGSVGIEALSQGASHCIFLDLNPAATEVIKRNLKACNLSDKGEVRTTDAFSFLKHTTKSFDLIYVAPPQYKNLWGEACQMISEKPELIKSKGLMIAQIDPVEYELLHLTGFTEFDQRKYGKTLLVFYRKDS